MLPRSVSGPSSAFNGEGNDHTDRLAVARAGWHSEIFLILSDFLVALM